MLRAIRNIFRLVEIGWTLARHGALLPIVELIGDSDIATLIQPIARRFDRKRAGRPGEKLAEALVELGPSFIKLGQMLSTRSDLLGETMAADLSRLRDRLDAFPGAAAMLTIETELQGVLGDIYSHFEMEPVSAASIAQVHFAVTAEGEEVAVKVLRPGIEAAFARDIALMLWLARLIERAQPRLRRLKPIAVVRTFEATVRLEMDLRLEAAAAAELAANFAADPSYRVPAVDWQRTARRVLTIERLGGIPMDNREALIEAGHDIDRVLALAAGIFFNQVFRDGFFHGDQHPGNMFVIEDGAIGAVDFGIMGRLDRPTRLYLADMLLAFLDRNYARLAEIHFEAGYVPPDQSMEQFALACRSIGEPIFGRSLNEISFARVLGQLFAIGEAFDMEVQPQLLLLQKNMLMAEGVSRLLNPTLNIWTLAKPLVEDWMRVNRGPEARLADALADLAGIARRLPRLIGAAERLVASTAERGLHLDPETRLALAGVRHVDRSRRWIILLAFAALALAALALWR